MLNKNQFKIIFKKVGLWYLISIIFLSVPYLIYGTVEDFYFNIILIAGLLGGPYGACAVALAFFSYLFATGHVFIYNFSLNYLISISVIILSIFIFSYFVYKLWYHMDSSGLAIRLYSAESILKFLFLLVFVSLFSIVFDQHLSIIPITSLNKYDLLYTYLYHFFSSVNFCLLLIPFLLLNNYFNFTFYYPGKENIDFCNNFFKKCSDFKLINFINNRLEIFNIVFALFLLSMLFTFISSFFMNYDIFYLFSFFTLIFALIFIFKPLPNLKNPYANNFISLTEIMSSFFVVICILIFFSLCFLDWAYITEANIVSYDEYIDYLFFRFDTIMFVILIPSLALLFYIQKKITKPINKLSSMLRRYSLTNSMISEDTSYFNNFFNFFNRETEVSILAKSFYKMDKDLNDYIKNIKSLTKDKERIEAELDVAQHIQSSFLSTNFNIHPDVKISGEMISAEMVGGDFYDFFMVDDNHLAIVIGDVSDKGIPAALFMSKSIQLIQSYLNTLNSMLNLSDVIGLINNKLCENNDSCMFVTACIGILDLNSGKLYYVNAGHEKPIFKSNNSYSYLDRENDLVLGVMENEEFNVHELILDKGDEIILYTDGVTDTNNSQNEFFGRDNLLNILTSKNPSFDNTIEVIKDCINDFTDNKEQFDDMTLLTIKYDPKEDSKEDILHEEKELILSSTKDKTLYDVLDIINELVNDYDVNPTINFHIELIIEEIFVNIVKHAYKNEEGIIKIQYAILDNPLRLKIVFIDDGDEFNPLIQDNPDLSKDIDDREVGHLGIFMVREYADELNYEYIDNQNVFSVFIKL